MYYLLLLLFKNYLLLFKNIVKYIGNIISFWLNNKIWIDEIFWRDKMKKIIKNCSRHMVY